MITARISAFVCAVVLSACTREAPERVVTDPKSPVHHAQTEQPKFEADGYYFPSEQDSKAGSPIEHIRVMLPEVEVQLKQLDSSHHMILECKNPIVTPDRLHLECGAESQITLTIDGAFIDKRGNFWDQRDVEALKTVVLSARVKQLSKGRAIYSRDERFTFWEGD